MSAHFKENIVNYFYNKSLYIKKKNLLKTQLPTSNEANGPKTTSNSNSKKFVRNAESWAPPQTYWIWFCFLTRLPCKDFPGSPVVKNQAANAGNMG